MVKVYGASDDLIEVEGDIQEEFSYRDGKTNYLAFSDGTVIDIVYGDEGIWRIHKRFAGKSDTELVQGTDSEKDYSDKFVLSGQVQWVVHGLGFVHI